MLRKIILQNDHYYHIYNRGVERIGIFRDKFDYIRFLVSLRDFNTKNPIGSLYELNKRREFQSPKEFRSPKGDRNSGLVEIICYSLVPNHYHLILKQLADGGISKFMHKLDLGYAMYFNHKYQRTGSLFQGKFRSAHIKDQAKLCWLSGYANCNVEIHKIAKAENWIWSSYLDYLGKRKGILCSKDVVLNEFKNVEEYKIFCEEVIKDARERKEILKLEELEN